jgi:hypothetical protein
MARYGGIHSLVAAASLFTRSLAAREYARSCAASHGMFLLSHRRMIPTLYLALWANPAVFVCLPATVIPLPVPSVCKLFSTVAAFSQ